MNTTTAPAPAAPVVQGSRRAARILGILAVLFAGLFATVGQAAPASAAGTYGTGVYFCTSANTNVSLELYYGGTSTSRYKTGNSGSTGCATFRYLDAGRTYIVTRTVFIGDCTYGGYMRVFASQYTARPGVNQVINVGSLTHWYTQRVC